ncbi:MAG: chemotaxis protein CheB [Bacteroidota bacterium]
MRSEAIVLGVSAGGFEVIKRLITALPIYFTLPIIIVQHLSDFSRGEWVGLLDKQCKISVKEVEEKEEITGGVVYLAPPNYHLLIENDRTFTLTVDERVNYARPSIDVLFESAAEAYGPSLVGIVGTGANYDGARGLERIKNLGGVTIVQDPDTAEVDSMPRAAIEIAQPQLILSLELIIKYVLEINSINKKIS